MKPFKNTGICWLWVSVAVFAADLISKYFVEKQVTLFDSVNVMSTINLTYTKNSGAAFSILSQESGWQIVVLSLIAIVVSAVIVVWLYRLAREQRWMGIALSLILGGALGNLFDRLRDGTVTDFIDFNVGTWHWPAFNLADTAICIGAVMMLIDLFRRGKQ